MTYRISRRSVLQATTGAALSAPAALLPPGSNAVAQTVTSAVPPTVGPPRRLDGVLVLADRSEVPSPFRASTSAGIALDITADGRGVLSLSYFDTTPGRVVLLPADVARALDHALFGVETATERRIREKRESGYVDCRICDRGRLFRDCPVCDADHLARPAAIAAFRFPWLTAAEVAPHLGALPGSWDATAADGLRFDLGLPRSHAHLASTMEARRVQCVEVALPGTGSPDRAEVRLRHGEGGGIAWWTAVGEYHDMQNPDVATIPEALDLAAASIRRGIAAMADPTLLTAHRGPWVTVGDVEALVGLVPAAWRPAVVGEPAYSDARIAEFRGTTEEGRTDCVTIDMPGLGPADADGIGPNVCLSRSEDGDGRLHWSASLVGGEVDPRMGSGDAATLREAVLAGVASIERRLAVPLTLAV